MDTHFLSLAFQKNQNHFENYLREEFEKTPPPVYLSCDVRNSGFKASVIDTNLFPGGFNNLCNGFHRQAIRLFKEYLDRYFPSVKKILIFPEAHTRNKFYFQNVWSLQTILQQTGREVKVGLRAEEFTEPVTSILLDQDRKVDVYRLEKEGKTVFLSGDWIPDLILSNNDFSSGPDPFFQEIDQPMIPSSKLGWFKRKKHHHFEIYNQIAREVAQLIEVDPWQISCLQTVVKDVDLQDPLAQKRMSDAVDSVLEQIRQKYREYEIPLTPYLFVKNNSGTYGMGILAVSSGEELLQLNRRVRLKLGSAKGGSPVSEYLIQEGIMTVDSYSGYPMEPVIYLSGASPIGGFFRLNEEQDEWGSLNSKGMTFSCLCLHKLDEPHEDPFLRCKEKKELLHLSYSLSRIAALAAAREEKEG